MLFYENWLQRNRHPKPLGALVLNIAKGSQQAESKKGSIDYCSIKHISGHELVHASRCLLTNETVFALKNDLLLAITGATIGKIGIVKRYSQLAFSGDLLRLRVKSEIDPHYLMLALDHTLGQVQFNRWITGSTNGHLAPRDVGRVLVPRLEKTVEGKIAQLVEESLAKRLESEHLLEQAKTSVEQLIEDAVRQ